MEFKKDDVIKIIKATTSNWYKKGETYTVHHTSIRNGKQKLHKDSMDSYWIDNEACELVSRKDKKILKNIQIW